MVRLSPSARSPTDGINRGHHRCGTFRQRIQDERLVTISLIRHLDCTIYATGQLSLVPLSTARTPDLDRTAIRVIVWDHPD